MYVKHHGRAFAKGLDQGRPKADVGDEYAVHDIQVNILRACFFDLGKLLAKTGKVSGKHGGGNDKHNQEILSNKMGG
jgi:hypothetical protein